LSGDFDFGSKSEDQETKGHWLLKLILWPQWA